VNPPRLTRLASAAWAVAGAGAVALLFYAVPRGDAPPLWFAAVVFAAAWALWFFPRVSAPSRRPFLTFFLLAFGVRVAAAVFFDALGRAGGDAFAGSPDARSYDLWARRLVFAWSELRDLNLHAWDGAGRWDVGFHYLLGVFYAVFGASALAGRVLGGFSGAAAAGLLYLVARRIANEAVAVLAGLLYSFWLSSIVWSSYSVLRDSLVWALILGAVWLVLRVVDGSSLAAFGLFFAFVGLRWIRPYAALFLFLGLGLSGLVALAARSREARRPALLLAATLLACEASFFLPGYPTVAGMMSAYLPERMILKTVETVPPVSAGFEESPPGKGQPAVAPPRRLFGPSVPANAGRFFLSPVGWAPVPYGFGNIDNWHLPGMWPWYAVLPAAALGAFLSLRAGHARAILVITTGFACAMLILIGRGDSGRHREMVVPVVLLCFAVGIQAPARDRRRLLVAYAIYAAALAAGIVAHRWTLKARGLARYEMPPRVAAQERAT
jgi:hypothetical protein